MVTKINPEITLTGNGFFKLKCFIESILKEDWYNKLGIKEDIYIYNFCQGKKIFFS